jgi:NRPS condensation-like uncharacterized protein
MLVAQIPDVALFGSTARFGDLCLHAAVDLARAFSAEELGRAVEATLQDFPVLDRHYKVGFWRDRWVPVPGPASDAVHIVDEPGDLEAATLSWVRRPLELTRDRPLRVVSLRRDRGSRLLVSLTHVVADGAGMAAVAHVLGAHLYGVPPSLPVDGRRDVVRVLERLRWYHAPTLAKDVGTLLLQPLRMLAAGKRERLYPPGGAGTPTYRHLSVSAADLARLKTRWPGASVNDVLVAALARASARRSSRGPVPVLYTMDLRRYASAPRLSAANTSSILAVLVPRDAASDLDAAVAAVAEATAGHRRGLAGPAFLLTPLALALLAPHAWVRRLSRALHPVLVDAPLDRGLLVTNVGKIDQGLAAFGADIEDLRVIGPNIEGVSVPVVVAFGFRGRLHLDLYAPRTVAAEALDELAGVLCEAFEGHARP